MPTVLPISGPAVLLRASLERAASQVTSAVEHASSEGDFATAVGDLIDTKLSVHATAYVAQTLEELTGDLLMLPRK